mmetsp:Transcript_18421/g.44346  ORF Transcript_18421/g.44346 Transcript_18421/m.44346 type:complete len:249 (+) Transcript_18421:374-1120(+)
MQDVGRIASIAEVSVEDFEVYGRINSMSKIQLDAMLSKYGKVLQQPSEMTPDLKEGIRNYFKPPTRVAGVQVGDSLSDEEREEQQLFTKIGKPGTAKLRTFLGSLLHGCSSLLSSVASAAASEQSPRPATAPATSQSPTACRTSLRLSSSSSSEVGSAIHCSGWANPAETAAACAVIGAAEVEMAAVASIGAGVVSSSSFRPAASGATRLRPKSSIDTPARGRPHSLPHHEHSPTAQERVPLLHDHQQ